MKARAESAHDDVVGRSRIIESDRLDFGPTEVEPIRITSPHHLRKPDRYQSLVKPVGDRTRPRSARYRKRSAKRTSTGRYLHYRRADGKEQDGHLLRLTDKRR